MKIKGGCVFRPRYRHKGKKQIGLTWVAQYRSEGRIIRESTKTTDKPEAEQFLLKRMAEVAEGQHLAHVIKGTVGLFLKKRLDTLQETKAITPETAERYRYHAAALLALGSPLHLLSFRKLTWESLDAYITYRLKQGTSNCTLWSELGMFIAALDEARFRRLLSVEVFTDIKYKINPRRHSGLKGASKRRDRIIFPHEIGLLFAALPQRKDGTVLNMNLKDAITLALWTGLRQENILELTEGQIRLDASHPVIRYVPDAMKSDRSHLVRLCPVAAEVIWRRCTGGDPSRRIFGDFLPAWTRLNTRLRREGKLVDFRWHDFRRSYTSYRLAVGIDPKTVQFEVAHRDSRMTMDTYGQAITDPEVRAWALDNFRFPWDPAPLSQTVQDPVQAAKVVL